MLKFTSIVGYTSCGPMYIGSFLTIFGQCINGLNYNVHYALHAAKIGGYFLMLKNPVGFIALCNPFASAMSVVKRLFMYLIYQATLKNVF